MLQIPLPLFFFSLLLLQEPLIQAWFVHFQPFRIQVFLVELVWPLLRLLSFLALIGLQALWSLPTLLIKYSLLQWLSKLQVRPISLIPQFFQLLPSLPFLFVPLIRLLASEESLPILIILQVRQRHSLLLPISICEPSFIFYETMKQESLPLPRSIAQALSAPYHCLSNLMTTAIPALHLLHPPHQHQSTFQWLLLYYSWLQ